MGSAFIFQTRNNFYYLGLCLLLLLISHDVYRDFNDFFDLFDCLNLDHHFDWNFMNHRNLHYLFNIFNHLYLFLNDYLDGYFMDYNFLHHNFNWNLMNFNDFHWYFPHNFDNYLFHYFHLHRNLSNFYLGNEHFFYDLDLNWHFSYLNSRHKDFLNNFNRHLLNNL